MELIVRRTASDGRVRQLLGAEWRCWRRGGAEVGKAQGSVLLAVASNGGWRRLASTRIGHGVLPLPMRDGAGGRGVKEREW